MRISNEKKVILKEYYQMIGKKVYFFEKIKDIKDVFNDCKGNVIIVDNRIIRFILRRLGYTTNSSDFLIDKAKQYIAFKEAIWVSRRKNVLCFYFNRIGKKENFTYDRLAVKRINEKLNFPKMSEDVEKYEVHLSQIVGKRENLGKYIEEIKKIPQVIKKGDVYCHEDAVSKYVNVIDGKRITKNQPETPTFKLHIYGRCGAFGYAVEDDQTIASYMQEMFNEKGMNIMVINHGLWGGEDDIITHNFILDSLNFDNNDIILFYQSFLPEGMMKILSDMGIAEFDITDEWHLYEEAVWCFYDKPGHMNSEGYRNTAKIIFNKITPYFDKPIDYKNDGDDISIQIYNEYIKKSKNIDFDIKLNNYIKNIKENNEIDMDKVYGAIVMNCNPFTYGHRFLVEKALEKVNKLFIFVVEENRSFFSFSDRFEMVKKGLEDLEEVIVVPSGEFIISSLTFPEYFLKDYVKERNFDISSDLRVFCEYIAPALNITKRFAGEEPFDPVTNNYNDSMKKILPSYGIEFVEIPRAKTKDGKEIINATRVRELLNEKKYYKLKEYVPESTYRVLIEKYK